LLLAVTGCQGTNPFCGCHSEIVEKQLPPTTQATPGVVPITPATASIRFTGSTSLMSHEGHFESFDGALQMASNDPHEAHLHVVVDMKSVSTHIGLLTSHLKGEDFFDVARYPQAEFESESITPTAEPGRYQVTGQISLHGQRGPITFPARIRVNGNEISFEGTFSIRQSEFGMSEAARKTNDEVPVQVAIHGQRG
jgi:polyisoprenoid-binding protein YceI